jgi:hypothetical protein
MELGSRSHAGHAPSQGANRMPPGRSAPKSAGVGAGVERTGMQTPLSTPRQGILLPGGVAAALPRPFAPSCHLLPIRLCGWWDSGPGDERRAHQSLPTDRTAFRMRLTPLLATALPIHMLGRLHRPLAELLTAHRQRPMNCSRGKRIVRCCAWPPGPWARSSYRKTTCWPSHESKRALEIGPPRRYRAK